MPADGIITLDNGVYKIWFARNYKAHQPNTVLLDNALATMGAGLPSAMAARLVYPERRIMAICGDGGFMMNSQELETAVRLQMNLVILILRDDAYGMIKWKQAGMRLPDFGLDLEILILSGTQRAMERMGIALDGRTSCCRCWNAATVRLGFTSSMCPLIIPIMIAFSIGRSRKKASCCKTNRGASLC